MRQGTGAIVLLVVLMASRPWSTAPPPVLLQSQAAPRTQPGDPASRDADQAPKPVAVPLLERFGWRRGESLETLVVTLPDPRASRLDWMYDTHLDALRRAFERAGFVLDSFDLPWQREPEAGAEIRLAQRPGAILFRDTPSAEGEGSGGPGEGRPPWLVFVVGELSTGGVDREALHLALEERATLCGAQHDLSIVGPVFSGSCSSLRQVLVRELASGGRLDGASVHIVSGSATSARGLELEERGRPRITFASTLHTDATLLAALRTQVQECLELESGQIAILQESTTEYGGSAAGDQGCELVIPFPMSIGSLRRASSRDRGVAAPEDPGKPRQAWGVELDLDDGVRPELPRPSSKLSAPSVDLLLEEITRMLAQRGIRLVLIFATDVRDKLFLGRELRRRLPDVQLVTTESNVLYLRPDFNLWLRGMLVLSTYPLLLRGAAWRPQTANVHDQLMFANEGAQGTFNAVLYQLARRGASDAEVLVADYGHPLNAPGQGREWSGVERPPIWITAVGATTMLPLAVLPRDAPGAGETRTPVAIRTKASPKAPGRAAATRTGEPPGPEQGPESEREAHGGRGFLAVLTVSLLSLMLLATFVAERFESSRHSRTRRRLLAPRGEPESESERSQRIALALQHELYVGFWYLAMGALLLPSVVLMLSRQLGADAFLLPRWLGLGAIAVGVLAALLHGWRAGIVWRQPGAWYDLVAPRSATCHSALRRLELLLRVGIAALGLAYVVVSAWWSWELRQLSPEQAWMLFHRAIELDQGLSPLVPMFLLGALLSLWGRWHCTRIRGLALREPLEAVRHESRSGLRNGEEVRERLFLAAPSGWRSVMLLAAMLLAIAWTQAQYGKSLEHLVSADAARPFELLLCFGTLGAMAASVWAAHRLLAVWRALERALPGADALSALPFGDLARRQGIVANLGLWPTSQARELRRAVLRRWDALLDPGEESAAPARPAELAAALEARAQGRSDARAVLEAEFVRVWERCRAWRPVRRDVEKERPRAEWERTEGEIAVLEVLIYVEWVLRQLRTLSTFLLLAIVLTTLLIASYPYQPQQLIQTISLLVFLMAVVVTVFVIGSMNRNHALSRMANTPPNRLSWDRTLFVNLALFLVVPLLTLASSQNAGLRGLLFEWLDPLLRFLVTS